MSTVPVSVLRLRSLVLAFLFPVYAAFASPLPTATTLVVSVNGAAATTAAPGSVVTLAATVFASSVAASPGQVQFCDSVNSAPCTLQNIVGTAQVTASGTANFRFVPGPGPHIYQAIFVGTRAYGPSSSSSFQFSELFSSTTTATLTGSPGNYTISGQTTTNGYNASDTVSFVDDYFSPLYTIATEPLTTNSNSLTFNDHSIFNVPSAVSQTIAADFNVDGVPDLATSTVLERFHSGCTHRKEYEIQGFFASLRMTKVSLGTATLNLL